MMQGAGMLAPRAACAPLQLLSLRAHYAALCRGCPSQRRSSTRCPAKRQSKEEAAAGEWAALLGGEEEPQPAGGVTAQDLNELCNRGVKLMLDENVRELHDFRDELNAVGKVFTDEGNMDGATFVYALYMTTEHVLVEQIDSLKGIYADAFTRVYGLLEDSGWQLAPEGEERAEAPSLDDIPQLGYTSYTGGSQ